MVDTLAPERRQPDHRVKAVTEAKLEAHFGHPVSIFTLHRQQQVFHAGMSASPQSPQRVTRTTGFTLTPSPYIYSDRA